MKRGLSEARGPKWLPTAYELLGVDERPIVERDEEAEGWVEVRARGLCLEGWPGHSYSAERR